MDLLALDIRTKAGTHALQMQIVLFLNTLEENETLTTHELMERLVPAAFCTEGRMSRRTALITKLVDLARKGAFPQNCFRGNPHETRKFMGRSFRPYLWHKRRTKTGHERADDNLKLAYRSELRRMFPLMLEDRLEQAAQSMLAIGKKYCGEGHE